MDADGTKNAALNEFRSKLLQHKELDARVRQRTSRARLRRNTFRNGNTRCPCHANTFHTAPRAAPATDTSSVP